MALNNQPWPHWAMSEFEGPRVTFFSSALALFLLPPALWPYTKMSLYDSGFFSPVLLIILKYLALKKSEW